MTLTGFEMGEVDGDAGSQHSPSTRRPSPTSVQELLDLVHLQQSTKTKRRTDKLLATRSLAPLPAIGRKGDVFQYDGNLRDIEERNIPASQFSRSGVSTSKSFPPPQREEQDIFPNSSRCDRNVLNRQESHVLGQIDKTAPKPSKYSLRREGTNYRLPPLSELQKAKEREIKAYEISQEKARAQKRSANIEYYLDDSPPRPAPRAGSRGERPRTSRGRRKMPSPDSLEDYGTSSSHRNGNFIESLLNKDEDFTRLPEDSSLQYSIHDEESNNPRHHKLQRPKSARGRRQPTFISKDDYRELSRPRAPSPPNPGMYSDEDECNVELHAMNAR